jgi:hypothetical protein
MSVAGFNHGDLESRAWRSVFQDGLWDIALGIAFLGVGLCAALDLPRGWTYLLYAAAVVLNVAVLRVGKQLITIPRLGWVKFGAAGGRRRRNAVAILAVGVLLMVSLIPLTMVMRSRPAGPSVWAPLISALAVATLVWVVLSLLAAFWDFSRLYVHAFIIGGSFFLLEWLGMSWPMLAGSVIVLTVGIWYLVRFLKLYPKPSPEATNAIP